MYARSKKDFPSRIDQPFQAVVDYGTDLYVDPDTGLLSAQMPAAMAAMLWSDPNEVDFFDENWQLAPPPPTMKSGVNSEGGTLSYHHNGSARQMKACLMPDSSDAYQVYVDLGKAITQNCPAFRAKTIQWYQE
ncbi:MAG: hypothetical protein M1838_005146 [Thelocarpon superellum]|nr:MAG: hypothetical protein M1838_005146 [Thelocarpon superellum]